MSSVINENIRKVDYNPFAFGPILKALPTTESQREIWATLEMDKHATLCYNEALSIKLEGEINYWALKQSINAVVNSHESLRSTFSPDGQYFFVQDQRDIPLLISNSISKLEVTKTAFDLIHGPLFNAQLFKHSELGHELILSTHHIVCDGWSFAILLEEIGRAYNQIIDGKNIQENDSLQFSQIAMEEAQKGTDEKHKKYWVNQHKGKQGYQFIPTDFERPSFRSYNSDRIDIALESSVVLATKEFARKNGCSLYTVLMTGFSLLLHKINKSSEITIGMASAGQSSPGKETVVGHLVNLLPLRTQVNDNAALVDHLRDMRSLMLAAFEHSNYSFGSLIKVLGIERDPSQIPLCNIVFNIDQQSPNQGLHFKNIKASYKTLPRYFENFELFVNVVSCGDQLTVECQYNTNLFKYETVKNWIESFEVVLREMVRSPLKKVADLQILNLIIPVTKERTEKEETPRVQVDERFINMVQEIWEEVLQIKEIYPSKNFFHSGGHSLLAVKVSTLFKEKFQIEVAIRDIFENPTVEELAARIQNLSSATKAKTELKELQPRGLTEFSVTPSQMQTWYLEQIYPNTTMHNLPSSIRMKGRVDRIALQKSLHFLIRRHPSLRTVIEMKEGSPIQRVLREEELIFPVLEEESCSLNSIQDVLNQESQFVFDLLKAPLYRAKLYRLDDNDFVFYFMVHHTIWDGWSFDIFFEELNKAYSAFVNDKEAELCKTTKLNYLDYSSWLQEELNGGGLEKERLYWIEKLKGPLPVLELPVDKTRPLVASHVGGTVPFVLDADSAKNIRTFAKNNNTSLYHVLVGAFSLALSKYAKNEDVIIGTPVRNRLQPELLEVIGYFVNTVALRTHPHSNVTFGNFLKSISSICLEAFDHQTLPFQYILNELKLPRDEGRTPVFQTFFSYQDVSNRRAYLGDLPYEQINIDKASTHTDLDLWIKASDNKIEGAFEYRVDLFERVTIERFKDCFLHIISEIDHFKDKEIKDCEILPPSQIDIIRNDWNRPIVPLENQGPVHKLFENYALQNPHKKAIESEKGSLTYGELSEKSNKIAQALVASGIKKGDLVGVSLPRDLNMVAALLGILKSGAGYVPLDPMFPQERLDFMIKNSHFRTVISDDSVQRSFDGSINVLKIKDLLQGPNSTPVNVYPSANDLMYVIYTSGSTGNPKGVKISHKSVMNFLQSMEHDPGFTSQDKLLAVTTISFDIHVLEIFLPLITGGSIYLASSYEVLDGLALKKILEEKSITVMQATPSSWRLLLSAGWNGSPELKVLCGGESFPLDLAQTLMAKTKEVWNMYGPTETTVWSSVKKLSRTEESITVGRPIDNTTMFILDQHLKPSPIGTPGELYIGGTGVSLGYFGRDDLTKERFIRHPLAKGEVIYATGDLARYRYDGEIECLGRSDGQVKIRGYRIELGEIEVAVSKMPGIKEASVVVCEPTPDDQRIVSFVVLSQATLFDENKIRDILFSKLPKYMVPSHFIQLEELPKTLNGKIDKKTLKSLFKSQERSQEPLKQDVVLREESNDFAQSITNIWQEVLGKEVQSHDDFFNIGGNSLLAVKLMSEVSKRWGMNLQLSVLLKAPTLDGFIKTLNKPSAEQNFTSMVPLKKDGAGKPIYCFHGVGGNVLNYHPLITYSNNSPLYAFQARGLDGVTPLPKTIEEMARFYIEELKAIDPHGPYILCGGSFGGMMAFEVAQQLRAAGKKIEKIILLDTFGPNVNIRHYDKSERSFWRNVKISIQYRIKALKNMMKAKVAKMMGLPMPIEVLLFNIEMNNYRALWSYKPQIYDGDVHIIRSKQRSTGWYSDPQMGWGKIITGKLCTYEIEATHNDFMESPEIGTVFSHVLKV